MYNSHQLHCTFNKTIQDSANLMPQGMSSWHLAGPAAHLQGDYITHTALIEVPIPICLLQIPYGALEINPCPRCEKMLNVTNANIKLFSFGIF
jgi:hypothetical protein